MAYGPFMNISEVHCCDGSSNIPRFYIQSAEGRKILSRVPDLGARRLRADLPSLCIGGWFVVWCMDSGAVVGVRIKQDCDKSKRPDMSKAEDRQFGAGRVLVHLRALR